MNLFVYLQVCGKSAEEQERAMIKCKVCGKSLLPYSMASHLKTHSETSSTSGPVEELPFGKRRSALRYELFHWCKAIR